MNQAVIFSDTSWHCSILTFLLPPFTGPLLSNKREIPKTTLPFRIIKTAQSLRPPVSITSDRPWPSESLPSRPPLTAGPRRWLCPSPPSPPEPCWCAGPPSRASQEPGCHGTWTPLCSVVRRVSWRGGGTRGLQQKILTFIGNHKQWVDRVYLFVCIASTLVTILLWMIDWQFTKTDCLYSSWTPTAFLRLLHEMIVNNCHVFLR